MISERMLKALNEQVRQEFYSAYLYLSMEAYYTSLNLNGFANWFHVQLQEERDHALLFFNYINRVRGKVTLGQIDAPTTDFASIEEVLKQTLSHEQSVTKLIYNLVEIALEEKDHTTHMFLQWFINEQVEEEANANNNLKRYRIVGNDGKGILMFDGELAARVYIPPAVTKP